MKCLLHHFLSENTAKVTVSEQAYAEIAKGTRQYFANLSEDLASYATHAHRKTIEKSDMLLLLKR